MESGLCIKFLSQLRINVAKKNLFFKISINKYELQLLNLLMRRGIVRRYFKLNYTSGGKELYMIYPNHTMTRAANLNLILFNRKADHIVLTLSSLKILSLSSGASSFVLKTDKGLLTHQEAIKNKVGGVLLCLIL
jgi:ribosomal protein S8